jgi:hypothetical protein
MNKFHLYKFSNLHFFTNAFTNFHFFTNANLHFFTKSTHLMFQNGMYLTWKGDGGKQMSKFESALSREPGNFTQFVEHISVQADPNDWHEKVHGTGEIFPLKSKASSTSTSTTTRR